MGEGRGAGNGQRQVEKMRCPMYSHAQDGLRSKVTITKYDVVKHQKRKSKA